MDRASPGIRDKRLGNTRIDESCRSEVLSTLVPEVPKKPGPAIGNCKRKRSQDSEHFWQALLEHNSQTWLNEQSQMFTDRDLASNAQFTSNID